MELESEELAQQAVDKLQELTIQEQKPVVMYALRTSPHQFESRCNTSEYAWRKGREGGGSELALRKMVFKFVQIHVSMCVCNTISIYYTVLDSPFLSNCTPSPQPPPLYPLFDTH